VRGPFADRVPPRLGDVLLVLLAVVVGAAALAVSMGYGLRDAPAAAVSAPTASPTASPTPAAVSGRQVRALFLGGSVLAGASREPGTPAVAEVASVQLGWTYELDGRLRAGFTTDGASAPRLSTLLPTDTDGPKPDVVVVQGGEADVDASPGEVRAGVTATVEALRTAFGPTTRLVLVGPYSPTAEPSDALLAVRDAVRDAAAASRVHFLDPLTAQWVAADDPPGLVNGGSLLPTAEGHLKIGRLLAEQLEALRIAPAA
jgi:hypothetical protein